jgi:hypothetical protein
MQDPEDKRRKERARYAALTPDQKRDKGREANQRTKAKLERLKKLEEENKHLRLEVEYRRRSQYGGVPLVDFAPFRMWLITKQSEYGTVKSMARIMEVDEGQMRRWLQGYVWERPRVEGPDWCGPAPIRSISLDVVDRVLTAEGSIRLDDLYPLP